jgi:tol-pal system protein YbgF
MRQMITIPVVVVSLCFFSGCSSITLLRIKELQKVETHIDSLKSDLASQQAILHQEQKNQDELLRLVRADMQVRFEELSQKFSSLEGSLSESKFKLSQIEKKTQDIQEQWKAKAIADSVASTQKNTQVDKMFQIAYGDFMAGRYDLAANGFNDIMNQFPEAPPTDEATYWYAECFYGKKEYEKAEQLYVDYLRKYREGKKVCASLLKMGLLFENKKLMEKRKLVWQKLITGCPDSPEAATAKERLGKQ